LEDEIKMDLRESGCRVMELSQLCQGRDQWRAVLNRGQPSGSGATELFI
jgi:hypothetical protein